MEMNFKQLFFFVGILTCISSYAGGRGGDVGNGGDTVYCESSPSSELNGYYNLDYLLTHISTDQNLAPVMDIETSLHRIGNLLAQHSPDLTDSFLNFQKYLNNHTDYLSPQLWSPARYGLVSISDEQMIKLLPPNCLSKDNLNQPQIIQTVIRRYEGALLKYYYDSEVMARLPALQLSFLYVHEWLWSFVSNPEAIRNINLFLHSKESSTLTHENFMAALNSFGFSFRTPSAKPLCAMHPSLKVNVESLTKTNCENFNAWDDVKKIDLKQSAIPKVPYAEFGLFQNLQALDLSSNEIKSLFPGTFLGNVKLSELSLSGNEIKNISNEQFRGLYALFDVNLKNNKVESLGPDIFVDQKSLLINLESNNIQTLDLYSLNVAPELAGQSTISLNLEKNNIQKIIATSTSAKSTFRYQYKINLGSGEIKEMNFNDFLKRLTQAKGWITFETYNVKNINLFKSQGLSCVLYTGTSRYECGNK